ncbi:Protein of unknown function [Cotesia congregata]|uniref:Uncharacterized protein n=1 Tax=Cotesia congregata TaxID=51543 RepID=A0A8J2MR54_COTCN|nr:Protein of unknown function [Cotesia congregata]
MNEGVDWKSEVGKVWAKMEIGVGRKSMRKIGGLDENGKGLVLVEMDGFSKKKEVMLAKSKLKGEIVRIEDDLTFEERRVKNIIIEEAMKERALGKTVKVRYMKMWVNGVSDVCRPAISATSRGWQRNVTHIFLIIITEKYWCVLGSNPGTTLSESEHRADQAIANL